MLKEQGPRAAMKLLNTVKDKIMTFVHEHRDEIVVIAKAATKSGVRLAAVQGAKLVSKKATKVVVNRERKASSKWLEIQLVL